MENGSMTLRSGAWFGLMAGFLLAPPIAMPQSTRPESLAQGKIIITPRESPDPHFANSVIVLARYDQTGALGLMLHYKSDLKLQKILAGVKGAENRSDSVFVGGPVELPSVLLLLRSKSAPANTVPITGNLHLATSKPAIAKALADRTASDIRIFVGYAGWGPGQLEREVRRRGWYIFDYDEALVFDEHPETLWDRLIEKTERRLAVLH